MCLGTGAFHLENLILHRLLNGAAFDTDAVHNAPWRAFFHRPCPSVGTSGMRNLRSESEFSSDTFSYPCALTAVIATTLIISSTEHPRLKSFTGFARPWMIGPDGNRARKTLHELVYPMLPDCRSGNTSTLACPATALPGDLSLPRRFPPARRRPAARRRTEGRARSCVPFPWLPALWSQARALRFPWWRTKAWPPSAPYRRAVCPSARWIPRSRPAAPPWDRGSPRSRRRSARRLRRSILLVTSIIKELETTEMPGSVLIICSAGRSTLPVALIAPATMPSASFAFTISAP